MEEKIDRRKKYILMIDTETANSQVVNDKLDLTDSLVYDCGLAIIDKKGNMYWQGSYLIRDIFIYEKDMMNSAYYAEKIPNYWKGVQKGEHSLISFYDLKTIVKEMCDKYNIKVICAHNASFDYRALNNTQRWLTKSKYRYFLPYGIEVWDTMRMAEDTICKQKSYIRFCERNGYVTSTGKVRKTAEILYKYISGNNDFIESHTGLKDVEIESQILAKCIAQHKKMRKSPWKN